MKLESGNLGLFVLATGQEDNIGDVTLRREYFDRLRPLGTLHIYLGSSPTDFVRSLQLADTDVVYTSLRRWHSAAWASLSRGPVWFVDKPGEFKLDRTTVRQQLKLVPLIIGIRLRKGHVLRLGLAMHSADAKYKKYLRPMLGLSTKLKWRDTDTRYAFAIGGIQPDWAFGCTRTNLDSLDGGRRHIAVTYRGDRDLLSKKTLSAITAYAEKHSHPIVVVNQVRRDTERSVRLASELGAELIRWPEHRSLAEHELILRQIYRTCGLVISDRLHALILAMTEGATPLCITDWNETKIERHLDAVGFRGSVIRAPETVEQIVTVLERHYSRKREAITATLAARSSLDVLTAELANLAAKRTRKDC